MAVTCATNDSLQSMTTPRWWADSAMVAHVPSTVTSRQVILSSSWADRSHIIRVFVTFYRCSFTPSQALTSLRQVEWLESNLWCLDCKADFLITAQFYQLPDKFCDKSVRHSVADHIIPTLKKKSQSFHLVTGETERSVSLAQIRGCCLNLKLYATIQ